MSIYITGLAAAIFKFLLPLTLGCINNRALDFMDTENVGVAVEISFLGVTEPDIPLCILFLNRNIFVTGFATAILDLRVGLE